MRKVVCLLAATVLLIGVLAVIAGACGGNSAADTSTTPETVGITTTPTEETAPTTGDEVTSTSETGDTVTSSVDDSTSTSEEATTTTEEATTTTEEATTTTEAARTTDTADHAADFRAQYPSSEFFNNSTWAAVNTAPGSHLGAAADVKGQPTNVTVDPDSRYLTWDLTVTDAYGLEMKVLCRTNVDIDRNLLSGPVEVKGIVVGAQGADSGGGAIVYVQSVRKAA